MCNFCIKLPVHIFGQLLRAEQVYVEYNITLQPDLQPLTGLETGFKAGSQFANECTLLIAYM